MYLEVESNNWGHLFYVSYWRRTSSRLQCKGTTFISKLFIEDLESGTVPGIEPATSRSAVKRSTNSANPARSNHPFPENRSLPCYSFNATGSPFYDFILYFLK